jgi:hypothetical protein
MTALLNLLCLLLPLAMLPGLMSAGTTPRWAVLALLVPPMLYWVDWEKVPHKRLLIATLVFAAFSLLWMEVRYDGYLELWRMTLIFSAFAVGAVCGNLERPLTLMAVSLALTLPLVFFQALGYQGIPQTAPPAGLFLNKNVLAESAAALLVAMTFLRRWHIAIPLLVITLLAQERAAYVGMTAAVILYLWPRRRSLAYALLACIGVSVLVMSSTPSALDRFGIWQDTLQGVTWMGQGIGSFFTMFPATATHIDTMLVRPEQAHNEFLHFLFELGIGSAGLWALGYFAIRGKQELERLVFASIVAMSLFAFPFHMPLTAFLAALVAGRLCSSERDDVGFAVDGRSRHA